MTATGGGSWEIAARYGVVDLSYADGAAGTALSANYQRIRVDRLSPSGSVFDAGALAPPAGVQIGQEFNVSSFRAQFWF